MKSSFTLIASLAVLISSAAAEVGPRGQCGGAGYKGDTACVQGTRCTYINPSYSECVGNSAVRADNDPIVGFGAIGSTTGGVSGSTIRVSTLAGLKAALDGNSEKTVILTASLKGNEIIKIGANTSLLGANSEITLDGIGLQVLGVSNVIVRNLKISKVLGSAGDAIGVQGASRVWIDHVDLSSDLDHGEDYYKELLDITHGCVNVTVSWSYLHDHYKASLVGSDDSDKVTTVTYHHNYFAHLNSQAPAVRFATVHIYNNRFDNITQGIDTGDGAQLLVENNVFTSTPTPLFSTDQGYAVVNGNDFGGATNNAPAGSLNSVPYTYSLSSTSSVESDVPSGAGAQLSF